MQNSKIDKNKIKELHNRLLGITKYLDEVKPHNPRKEVADNYNKILEQLSYVLEEELEDFKLPQTAFFSSMSGDSWYCYMDILQPKIFELIYLLESRYNFLSKGRESLDVQIYLFVRSKIGSFLNWVFSRFSK